MKNFLIAPLLLIVGSAYAADAPPAAPATTVVIDQVKEFNVGEAIAFNGVIRSRNDIALPASVDGELIWVLEEGARVKKGGVVAKIDDVQLKLRREEQVLASQRAKINLDYLDGEVTRLLSLEQANLAAKAMVAEMVSRRDFAKNDFQVSLTRIAQLDESLSRTNVVSPVDAVIVERLRQGGEFAQRGQTVVRILDPTSLEVQISVPVAYLNRIDKSKMIGIQIQDLNFETALRATVQVGNRLSQTFQILANVPTDIAPLIVTGQFADASVAISEDRTSLFVPRDAVILRTEGNFVFVIDDENKAKKIGVTLGEGQGNMVSVTGALQQGDKVAVRGLERLEDGQEVVTQS